MQMLIILSDFYNSNNNNNHNHNNRILIAIHIYFNFRIVCTHDDYSEIILILLNLKSVRL